MARTVFIERELTARRGRKKATVRLRFFKPVPDARGGWSCSFDVHVDGVKIRTPERVSGEDGLQALLLAIGLSVFTLEMFENETGWRIDDWAWFDVWKLRPRTRLRDSRRRSAIVREMERELTKAGRDTR